MGNIINSMTNKICGTCKYNVNKPSETIKTNKVVILDWDDTLFPTSWTIQYMKLDLKNVIDILKKPYETLDIFLINFIKELNDKTDVKDVVIVTNSKYDWINQCLNVLPNFANLVKNNNINIFSARDMFETQYPTDYVKWKIECFKTYLIANYIEDFKNYHIIVIGDSEIEHIAIKSLENSEELNTLIPKRTSSSIMTSQKPLISNIILELSNITKCFDQL